MTLEFLTAAARLDIARHAGTGQAVLPCFVGDSFPELRRAGGLIEELAEEQWMVLNESERRQPAVRLAIDRIAALLRNTALCFAATGRRRDRLNWRRAARGEFEASGDQMSNSLPAPALTEG